MQNCHASASRAHAAAAHAVAFSAIGTGLRPEHCTPLIETGNVLGVHVVFDPGVAPRTCRQPKLNGMISRGGAIAALNGPRTRRTSELDRACIGKDLLHLQNAGVRERQQFTFLLFLGHLSTVWGLLNLISIALALLLRASAQVLDAEESSAGALPSRQSRSAARFAREAEISSWNWAVLKSLLYLVIMPPLIYVIVAIARDIQTPIILNLLWARAKEVVGLPVNEAVLRRSILGSVKNRRRREENAVKTAVDEAARLAAVAAEAQARLDDTRSAAGLAPRRRAMEGGIQSIVGAAAPVFGTGATVPSIK